MTTAQKAAQEYIDRKSGKHNPDGDFDKADLWRPSETEKCDCCKRIRTPSRAFPYSLMTHCRSINHIASLYNLSKREVLDEVNKLR